jgi:Uma2 family endonuclease
LTPDTWRGIIRDMTAILEIPEVRERAAPLSVEGYHLLNEAGVIGKRTELIRGVVIEKMAKSPLHQSISKILYDGIVSLALPGYSVRQDSPLTLRDSEPEPDVAVVLGTDADFQTKHPRSAELAIEVAVSSVALDRENATLYAEAGVKEYWIVLARERQIEVYRNPEGGMYREKRAFSPGEELCCESVPAIRVVLAELFA